MKSAPQPAVGPLSRSGVRESGIRNEGDKGWSSWWEGLGMGWGRGDDEGPTSHPYGFALRDPAGSDSSFGKCNRMKIFGTGPESRKAGRCWS